MCNCQAKKCRNGWVSVRAMRSVPLLVVGVILSGCASYGTSISSKNYRERLSIKQQDATFYAGEYVGVEQECFPPITKKICKARTNDEPLYKRTKRLDMEAFEFEIAVRTPQPIVNGDPVRDFLYLSAADLAVQRGYKTFTTLSEKIFWLCSSEMEAQTFGSVSRSTYGTGTFSATTTLYPTRECTGNRKLTVLFFRDKDELKEGVLRQYHSGVLASDSVWPVTELYHGTVPNLQVPKDVISPSVILITDVPEGAWRVRYEAPLLSKDLRVKYQVTDESPYRFQDQAGARKNIQGDDPIRLRRVVAP